MTIKLLNGAGPRTPASRAAACLAAALLMLGGCSSRQHVASHHPAAKPGTAVAQAMDRQVINAADAGDGDYQLRALRQQVIADPGNLPARLQLANHYWKAGVTELAVEHYRFAAERFPENPHVAMLEARALRDSDHRTDAIAALVNFCKRNPNPTPDLLSLLGILQDDDGQFSEAEKVYRAALEQAPGRADLRNNLGYNLLLQGRPAPAVEQFQEALKIQPRSQVAHNNLGMALLAQWKDDSQPREALLHWQSVSGPATAHNNLATVLMEQARFSDARRELEIALDFQKDHPAALRNLQLVAGMDRGADRPERAAHNSFWKRVRTVFSVKKPAEPVVTASR